jgi:hypothetical protein
MNVIKAKDMNYKASGDGPKLQDVFDDDIIAAPPGFREVPEMELGTADIAYNRYTSQEWHEAEVKNVWQKVWQVACRLEEIPADCVEDPTSCGAFPVDKRTCEAGWSCAKKVKVSKSSFSPCTEELEQRGMCQIDPQRFWGCFNYVNVGMGNLKCDIRLNLLFADAIELSISRNEKLFYNQSQTICLGFDKPADQFVRVSAMSIVCTDLEDTTENKSLCDVETDLCKEQTLKTLLLQR